MPAPREGRPGFVLLIILVLVICVVAMGGTFVAAAEGGTFAPTTPSTAGPPWGNDYGVLSAYDAAAGYDVWFFPDGATWTSSHGTWTNVTGSAGVPPDMEGDSEMVYDAQGGFVLLYGGQTLLLGSPSSPLSQYSPDSNTWKYQGGAWTNITAGLTTSPPPRERALMAYDSTDQEAVFFGGVTRTGFVANDTWVFTAGAWRNVTAGAPPATPGNDQSGLFDAFVDDPPDGYVLYYQALSKCASGAYCPTTWTFHGGEWTNLTTSLVDVPTLENPIITYDSTSNKVLALGACLSEPWFTCPEVFGTFQYSTGKWTEVPTSAQPKEEGIAGLLVDDPPDGGLLLFSGCCWVDFSGLSAYTESTWVYAHGAWTETAPWGGGPPPFTDNDGTWMAVGLLAVPAVVCAIVLLRPPFRSTA